MKNTVIVQVNYSFKGENFSPSLRFELDKFAKQNNDFSSLYLQIAQYNKIDSYSYAYEVMQSSELLFHSPTGNVIDFIDNGKCDLNAYQYQLNQQIMFNQLEAIAADILGIIDIHTKEHQAISKALAQAYLVGSKQNNR